MLCTVNLLRHRPHAGKCFTFTGCCDNQEASGLLLCCIRVFLNWQRANINISPFLTDYRKLEGRISMIIVNVIHTQIEVTFSFSHEVSTRTGERFEVGPSCKFPNSDISRVRVSPKTVAWVWLTYYWNVCGFSFTKTNLEPYKMFVVIKAWLFNNNFWNSLLFFLTLCWALTISKLAMTNLFSIFFFSIFSMSFHVLSLGQIIKKK